MTKYDWINFELNLQKLPWQTWVRLGECASKCEQLKSIPLKPEIKEKLHSIYLTKGVHATTAIEGNTLTEEQVKDIIEEKVKLPPSKEYLEWEVQNIVEAVNAIAHEISVGNNNDISTERLCLYNKYVLGKGIPCAEGAVPGQIREHSVVVGNVYRAPQAKDVNELLRKFCDWMNGSYFSNGQMPIQFAIIKAIISHLYIAWIHPFGDGNGRVARLAEFAILLQYGVPSPAAHLLSNHYNITRTEYYHQLDKASKTKNPIDFLSYAVQGLFDGLEEQFNYIQKHILKVCWRDYIYSIFSSMGRSATLYRQRTLVLRLSEEEKNLNNDQIILLMDEQYRGKTGKTLARDFKKLLTMDLIVKEQDGYRAKKEIMLQYLPFSVNN